MQRHNNETIIENILLKNKKIEAFTADKKFGEATKLLLTSQKENWQFLKNGYNELKEVQTRDVVFDTFNIKLQFNPNRITSSNAAVDDVSVKERDCFLCPANLPQEQKCILYNETYMILCNPYPIFPEHFTLPNINHFPQSVKSSFKTLLNLGKDLSEYYSVFYNGPQCGASAPDHMHFQAGSKLFLPVEKDYDKLKELYGERIIKTKNLEVCGIDDGLRKFISAESKNINILIKVCNKLYQTHAKLFRNSKEPPMNIIVNYNDDAGWRVMFFLRSKHRPSHYFRDGKEKILISPGAADMGGVCILPMEKDYNDLDKTVLTQIFKEIGIGKESFVYVKSSMKEKLKDIFQP